MSEFVKLLVARLVREEEGQDLVEYAVLVVLIALAATVGVSAFGTDVSTFFSNLGAEIPLPT